MNMTLESREKVLFVAPRLYNYAEDLKAEMERQNYDVKLVKYSSGAHRLFWKIKSLEKRIAKERDQIIQLINDENFDIFFVIKGQLLSKEIVSRFKHKNPNAKTVTYQWDSLDNLPFDFDFVDSFDYKYSFDSQDCMRLSKDGLQHKPLFYTNDFIIDGSPSIKYDIATVGGMQFERTMMLKKLITLIPSCSYKILLRTEVTLSIPLNIIKVGLPTYFRFALLKDIERKEVALILKKSRVIIDIPNTAQSGLSMRTIEALPLKRKLITTNAAIKGYDFYNPNNHYVMQELNPNEIIEFIKKPFIQIDEKIIQKYSIKNFVSTILKNEPVEYIGRVSSLSKQNL